VIPAPVTTGNRWDRWPGPAPVRSGLPGGSRTGSRVQGLRPGAIHKRPGAGSRAAPRDRVWRLEPPDLTTVPRRHRPGRLADGEALCHRCGRPGKTDRLHAANPGFHHLARVSRFWSPNVGAAPHTPRATLRAVGAGPRGLVLGPARRAGLARRERVHGLPGPVVLTRHNASLFFTAHRAASADCFFPAFPGADLCLCLPAA
jgi:hypothetical protein